MAFVFIAEKTRNPFPKSNSALYLGACSKQDLALTTGTTKKDFSQSTIKETSTRRSVANKKTAGLTEQQVPFGSTDSRIAKQAP